VDYLISIVHNVSIHFAVDVEDLQTLRWANHLGVSRF
jgi:hypothetical protein